MATIGMLNNVTFQQPFARFMLVDGDRMFLFNAGTPFLIDRTVQHTFTVSVNPMKDVKWQVYKVDDSSKVFGSDKQEGAEKQIHRLVLAANDLPQGNTEYILRVWHLDNVNISCELEMKTNF